MVPVKFVGSVGDPVEVELLCVPGIGEVVELQLWNGHVRSWRRFRVLSVVHRVFPPDSHPKSTGHFVEVRLEHLGD